MTSKKTILRIDQVLSLIPEEEFTQMLDEFRCPRNHDIERFLTESALEFTRKKVSITYLVFGDTIDELLGFYSIGLKVIDLDKVNVSKSKLKKVQRLATRDGQADSYFAPAYLIAQLAKNFNSEMNKRLSGGELLGLAAKTIEDAVEIVGGTTVILEASPNEKLLDFYHHNRFTVFGERTTGEGDRLVQLLRTL